MFTVLAVLIQMPESTMLPASLTLVFAALCILAVAFALRQELRGQERCADCEPTKNRTTSVLSPDRRI